MIRSIKTKAVLSVALCGLLCLSATGFPFLTVRARALSASGVDAALSETPGQDGDGSTDAEAVDRPDVPDASDGDAAVMGAYDESPGGVSTFWGIVIALFVAGAVVFGIAVVIPHEDEDEV